MIIQKFKPYLLSTGIIPLGVSPDIYDTTIRSYIQAVRAHKGGSFPVPDFDSITAYCARDVRGVILSEAMSIEVGSEASDLFDTACELMTGHLDACSYNGWIEVKGSLDFANLCYATFEDENEIAMYYTIHNSPQLNMFETLKRSRGSLVNDPRDFVYESYKSLDFEKAYEYQEVSSEVSSEVYLFELDMLDKGGDKTWI